MANFRRASVILAPEALTGLTVPKNRKPKFELLLKIIDLNNVPYVTGKFFIKWQLPQSTAAEHRGRTHGFSIKDHRVTFHYEQRIPVRMVIEKNGMLQETQIQFEVMHEVMNAGKAERILLGNVKLNLAEYVEASEHEGEDAVSRRYLLQDSKINSTVKITLYTKQVEGDRNFIPPPLKTAPVFTGIAGLRAGEQGDLEDAGSVPTMQSKTRETGDELRDLYARTLAAQWTCQPGELSADKCIEDIFAGGDGWGSKVGGSDGGVRFEGGGPRDDILSDSEVRPRSKRGNNWSSGRRHDIRKVSRESLSNRRDDLDMHSVPRARASFEQQAQHSNSDPRILNLEVDEFDVREDLRSWKSVIG
ncbi:hypothetical protein EJ06DRAFT_504834 [Trichodelitschia bisporula]|uniref:C2 NT-type domain-containing protein n=1 Tax=Trichodelitschia bisporula TaxID=703511 RepID=A0A6G1I5P1_9PEZI|nr:hypothetical protein EJ06DRAFT_504834 [Trichodelitschia bisporula]